LFNLNYNKLKIVLSNVVYLCWVQNIVNFPLNKFLQQKVKDAVSNEKETFQRDGNVGRTIRILFMLNGTS